ncbi:hypothetical protein FN976_22215 [Caenimonas sedimenti]|uniref:Uncharacterized protein n=1 Tax=Caenimonas sedimenti TaxID=2596921 RepID=A0A562ZJX8_9BURK|nr:hypothetical protein [Caenimonas sedimenti]TWO68711.1 hypothetical protein FN976_22215 [Caenimonas sedimenti]
MPSQRIVLLLLLLASPWPALACSPCRTMVFASVFDSHFTLRLMLVVLPVALLVLLATWLYRTTESRHDDAHVR